jgi:hypothetical protein
MRGLKQSKMTIKCLRTDCLYEHGGECTRRSVIKINEQGICRTLHQATFDEKKEWQNLINEEKEEQKDEWNQA